VTAPLQQSPLADRSSPAWSNVNSLWGAFTVELLVRRGVTRWVVSPGSRSAPLAYAAACHPSVQLEVVLDERSAAFFALGCAKAAAAPVAVVATSGTAIANWLPAVVEAAECGVPLILLSADRPLELRHCRAGQTIAQPDLFGRYPVFAADAPLPEADAAVFARWRDLLIHAVDCCAGSDAGPVHLNCGFREPLAPTTVGDPALALLPVDALLAGVSADRSPRIAARRGLILAGAAQPADTAAYCAAVAALARRCGWPVLADVSSPLRHALNLVPNVVWSYDSWVRAAGDDTGLQPDAVICLEEPPTSKVLRQWLERAQPPCWLLRADRQPVNPCSLPTRRWRGSVAGFSAALQVDASADPQWLASWTAADARCRRVLEDHYTAVVRPFCATDVPWVLSQHLPAGACVFIASSLPIRDAEWFWPASQRGFRIQVNRGANGIDGTLSSALGMAAAGGAPAWLVCGDLAFLHDAGALAIAAQSQLPLTMIVVDNRGGGIFEHLPIAAWDPPFERVFATPQPTALPALAAAHGIVCHTLTTPADLAARLIAPASEPGPRILIIATDRKAEAARRKGLLASMCVAFIGARV
jgi:2-succinyl-5-enolpyruvyl-6-hydroxy-3-cyclohexene-1-carboxylate synthase